MKENNFFFNFRNFLSAYSLAKSNYVFKRLMFVGDFSAFFSFFFTIFFIFSFNLFRLFWKVLFIFLSSIFFIPVEFLMKFFLRALTFILDRLCTYLKSLLILLNFKNLFLFFLVLFLFLLMPGNDVLFSSPGFYEWTSYNTSSNLSGKYNFFQFTDNLVSNFLQYESKLSFSKTSPFVFRSNMIPNPFVVNAYPTFFPMLDDYFLRQSSKWFINMDSLDYWALRKGYCKGWLPYDQIIHELDSNSFLKFIRKFQLFLNTFIFKYLPSDFSLIYFKYWLISKFSFSELDLNFFFFKLNIPFFFLGEFLLYTSDNFLVNFIVSVKLFLTSFLNLVFDDICGILLRYTHYLNWYSYTTDSFLPIRSRSILIDQFSMGLDNLLNTKKNIHRISEKLNYIKNERQTSDYFSPKNTLLHMKIARSNSSFVLNYNLQKWQTIADTFFDYSRHWSPHKRRNPVLFGLPSDIFTNYYSFSSIEVERSIPIYPHSTAFFAYFYNLYEGLNPVSGRAYDTIAPFFQSNTPHASLRLGGFKTISKNITDLFFDTKASVHLPYNRTYSYFLKLSRNFYGSDIITYPSLNNFNSYFWMDRHFSRAPFDSKFTWHTFLNRRTEVFKYISERSISEGLGAYQFNRSSLANVNVFTSSTKNNFYMPSLSLGYTYPTYPKFYVVHYQIVRLFVKICDNFINIFFILYKYLFIMPVMGFIFYLIGLFSFFVLKSVEIEGRLIYSFLFSSMPISNYTIRGYLPISKLIFFFFNLLSLFPFRFLRTFLFLFGLFYFKLYNAFVSFLKRLGLYLKLYFRKSNFFALFFLFFISKIAHLVNFKRLSLFFANFFKFSIVQSFLFFFLGKVFLFFRFFFIFVYKSFSFLFFFLSSLFFFYYIVNFHSEKLSHMKIFNKRLADIDTQFVNLAENNMIGTKKFFSNLSNFTYDFSIEDTFLTSFIICLLIFFFFWFFSIFSQKFVDECLRSPFLPFMPYHHSVGSPALEHEDNAEILIFEEDFNLNPEFNLDSFQNDLQFQVQNIANPVYERWFSTGGRDYGLASYYDHMNINTVLEHDLSQFSLFNRTSLLFSYKNNIIYSKHYRYSKYIKNFLLLRSIINQKRRIFIFDHSRFSSASNSKSYVQPKSRFDSSLLALNLLKEYFLLYNELSLRTFSFDKQSTFSSLPFGYDQLNERPSFYSNWSWISYEPKIIRRTSSNVDYILDYTHFLFNFDQDNFDFGYSNRRIPLLTGYPHFSFNHLDFYCMGLERTDILKGELDSWLPGSSSFFDKYPYQIEEKVPSFFKTYYFSFYNLPSSNEFLNNMANPNYSRSLFTSRMSKRKRRRYLKTDLNFLISSVYSRLRFLMGKFEDLSPIVNNFPLFSHDLVNKNKLLLSLFWLKKIINNNPLFLILFLLNNKPSREMVNANVTNPVLLKGSKQSIRLKSKYFFGNSLLLSRLTSLFILFMVMQNKKNTLVMPGLKGHLNIVLKRFPNREYFFFKKYYKYIRRLMRFGYRLKYDKKLKTTGTKFFTRRAFFKSQYNFDNLPALNVFQSDLKKWLMFIGRSDFPLTQYSVRLSSFYSTLNFNFMERRPWFGEDFYTLWSRFSSRAMSSYSYFFQMEDELSEKFPVIYTEWEADLEDEDIFNEIEDRETTFHDDPENIEYFVTSFNDEHDFSEKFIDSDYFFLLPKTSNNFLIPLQLSNFWSSFDYSDQFNTKSSGWLVDVFVDRFLFDISSNDSIMPFDRFLLTDLNRYSKYLFLVDTDMLRSKSSLTLSIYLLFMRNLSSVFFRRLNRYFWIRSSYPFFSQFSENSSMPGYRISRFSYLYSLFSGFQWSLNNTYGLSFDDRHLKNNFIARNLLLVFYNPYNTLFLRNLRFVLGLDLVSLYAADFLNNRFTREFFKNPDYFINLLKLRSYPQLTREEVERLWAFLGCTEKQWHSVDVSLAKLVLPYDNWNFPIALFFLISLSFHKTGNYLWGLWTYKVKEGMNSLEDAEGIFGKGKSPYWFLRGHEFHRDPGVRTPVDMDFFNPVVILHKVIFPSKIAISNFFDDLSHWFWFYYSIYSSNKKSFHLFELQELFSLFFSNYSFTFIDYFLSFFSSLFLASIQFFFLPYSSFLLKIIFNGECFFFFDISLFFALLLFFSKAFFFSFFELFFNGYTFFAFSLPLFFIDIFFSFFNSLADFFSGQFFVYILNFFNIFIYDFYINILNRVIYSFSLILTCFLIFFELIVSVILFATCDTNDNYIDLTFILLSFFYS